MKWFFAFVLIAAAIAAGYLLEPQLRGPLTAFPPQAPAAREIPLPAQQPAPPQAEPIAEPVAPIAPTPHAPPVEIPSPPPVTATPEPAPPEPAPPDLPEAATLEVPASPAPTPAPVPETVLSETIKAMQESIRSGAVTEFTFEQVEKWEDGPQETIKGEVFQTGIAHYSAQTIFGKGDILAKALLQDGKVVRWIWAESGIRIK